MTMTNRDYAESDHWQSRYDACYDVALAEFKDTIEPIKQSFEHKLNDDAICDVDYSTLKLLVNSVELMLDKSEYHYVDDYDDVNYSFHKELKDILLDEYGWEI